MVFSTDVTHDHVGQCGHCCGNVLGCCGPQLFVGLFYGAGVRGEGPFVRYAEQVVRNSGSVGLEVSLQSADSSALVPPFEVGVELFGKVIQQVVNGHGNEAWFDAFDDLESPFDHKAFGAHFGFQNSLAIVNDLTAFFGVLD